MTSTSFASVVIAVTLHAAQPALAEGRIHSDATGIENRRAVVVNVADLDLSAPDDVRELHRRVRRAARRACDGGVSALYLQLARTKADGCYRLTVADALRQASRRAEKSARKRQRLPYPESPPESPPGSDW